MVKNTHKPRLRNRVANHAIDTVVPRKRNGYRPYLTNRYGIALIIMMVFSVAINYTQEGPDVLGAEVEIQPAQLLQEVNNERASEDLPALSIDQNLAYAAEAKARDMIANQYWAHESPSGVTPWKWVNESGYHYAYAGENLAKNFASAGSTVAAWMASEGHRRNVMHEYYTDAGFAVVDGELDGENVTLVVALFATPAASLTTVAGATTFAPGTDDGGINPFARFGIILQSSNSTTVGVAGLVIIALIISLVAFVMTHWQRLTKTRQTVAKRMGPWYKDRSTAKLLILTIVTIGASILFGSGQV